MPEGILLKVLPTILTEAHQPRVGQFVLLRISKRLVKVLCMKESQSVSHRQRENLDGQVYLPAPLGCSFESLPRCNKT